MATLYHDPGATGRFTLSARANSTAYSVGDKRYYSALTNRYWLECTTAGTSAGAPPAFNTGYGQTTTDGTVVWTTRGTGDAATPADRTFHFEDTFNTTTSNMNAVASGDVLAFNSGTYARSSGNVLISTPTNGSSVTSLIYMVPWDSANNRADPSLDVIFDGTGSTTNPCFRVNNQYWMISGFQFNVGATHGLAVTTAGDALRLHRCQANNNTTDGFNFAANTGLIYAQYCSATGNGNRGFAGARVVLAGTACSVPILYKCYAKDNTYGNYTSFGAILDCESFYTTKPNSAYVGDIDQTAVVTGNTIRQTMADPNDGNSYYGIVGNSYYGMITNNIMNGILNGGAGAGYGINAAGCLISGNTYYGCDNAITGTPGVDGELGTRNTTNPSFTSSTDCTPTASLAGIATPQAIGGDANWIIPGAVQKIPSASSGVPMVGKNSPLIRRC